MKLCTCLFLIMLSVSLVKADVQYYESVLTNNGFIKLNPESFVSDGSVRLDYLELRKIASQEYGYIEFEIDPTNHVEVSLTEATDPSARYGFIFRENNEVFIQHDGVQLTLPFTISYSSTDLFKLQRCAQFLEFFKNGELIYQSCDLFPSIELFHTLHVVNAQNTKLKLLFDSDITCNFQNRVVQQSNMSNFNSPTFMDDSTNDYSKLKNKDNKKTLSGFPKNRLVGISVFDDNNNLIKSYRIRASSKGEIPRRHEVYNYLDESHKVEFKTIDNRRF